MCSLDRTEYSKSIYNLNLENPKTNVFEFSISTILRITCSDDYQLIGTSQIICEKNDQGGEWNQAPPTCKLSK
jgi:hypothetical protein